MSEQLEEARDELEQAAKSADDGVRDEIRETTDALADYVMSDIQPDHALLDDRLNTLRQVQREADGNTEAKVTNAIEAVEDYRKTIDQA